MKEQEGGASVLLFFFLLIGGISSAPHHICLLICFSGWEASTSRLPLRLIQIPMRSLWSIRSMTESCGSTIEEASQMEQLLISCSARTSPPLTEVLYSNQNRRGWPRTLCGWPILKIAGCLHLLPTQHPCGTSRPRPTHSVYQSWPKPPTAASMAIPNGVMVDSNGTLWVSDSGNNRYASFLFHPISIYHNIPNKRALVFQNASNNFAHGQIANSVVGQSAVNTSNKGPVSATSLFTPQAVLFVADSGYDRVVGQPSPNSPPFLE